MNPPKDESKALTLIAGLADGIPDSAHELFPILYDELKSQAQRYLDQQPPSQTLAPTSLVHEAFLKIAGSQDRETYGREHFLALAAKAMREILIDHTRRRQAAKRGGDWRRITLRGVSNPKEEVDVLAIDDGLKRLQSVDARGARIIEMRFFGDMTVRDIAAVLGISRASAHRDLAMAMAWLNRTLSKEQS